MASSSLPAEDDFFNFTKISFFCKKESKTFKILLSCYSSGGQCIFTKEEKKKFSFICPICCSVNQLDFTQMCNEYTIKLLQNKTLVVNVNILKEIEKRLILEKKCVEKIEIERTFIKLRLQEYN